MACRMHRLQEMQNKHLSVRTSVPPLLYGIRVVGLLSGDSVEEQNLRSTVKGLKFRGPSEAATASFDCYFCFLAVQGVVGGSVEDW